MGNKNGGLKVPNKRIAAGAMGDAAQTIIMEDSESTTTVLPLGQWGTPLRQQIMGDSKSVTKIPDMAMGDAAWATKTEDSKSATTVLPLM